MPWKVTIIESERGWGQKVDEVKSFPSFEEAKEFQMNHNVQNNKSETPDIYWVAKDPHYVSDDPKYR